MYVETEWKKLYHANTNQKEVRVAILISDKIDLRTRNITKNRERYYIMIRENLSKIQNNLKYIH